MGHPIQMMTTMMTMKSIMTTRIRTARTILYLCFSRSVCGILYLSRLARFVSSCQLAWRARTSDKCFESCALNLCLPYEQLEQNAVINNGPRNDTDSCDGLTNGRKMAPVLGVPPPPPPAPHMGPDGLILPRKPYNPYLSSTNHKDLRRELLFNQKVGKNVLNQKSELQRALEKQREAASRREAERNREENYKDDPRTALQRAIEQRAKHIEMTLEQSQPTEPPSNLLITARAKLRPRADSQ
ncbi:uncharacterized protein LOC100864983 isoform X2 [Apis florea]|uniref:uncharacterized protein LOC100864983 isoform X2 n=1 Tax=Apis florea TaxID=7463 RepID=UPI0006290F58|nr:uncharacterized protein LOC100864983 isoform X2 [Apis florea]